MKKVIIGAILAIASAGAMAQVSINVGQPGFYGRIDIGNFAPAPVVYGPPVVLDQRYYNAQPVYLRVPPGHRKHWSRFCGRYNACGQRVLFVRDDWYANTYVPRYQEYYRRGPGWHDGRRIEPVYAAPRGRDWDRGRDRGRDWDHDRGHGHDDRGHGRGHDEHGNGHGNGHGRGHGD